jgi:hypothetical protein
MSLVTRYRSMAESALNSECGRGTQDARVQTDTFVSKSEPGRSILRTGRTKRTGYPTLESLLRSELSPARTGEPTRDFQIHNQLVYTFPISRKQAQTITISLVFLAFSFALNPHFARNSPAPNSLFTPSSGAVLGRYHCWAIFSKLYGQWIRNRSKKSYRDNTGVVRAHELLREANVVPCPRTGRSNQPRSELTLGHTPCFSFKQARRCASPHPFRQTVSFFVFGIRQFTCRG